MAKTLKRLIDGQSIRIDAHKRCVPNECDNGIHIHKTQLNTNKGLLYKNPSYRRASAHLRTDKVPKD